MSSKQKSKTKKHILILIAFCIGVAFIGHFEQKAIAEVNPAFYLTYKASRHLPENPDREMSEAVIHEFTAYNVGDPAQTDDSPCIGASGLDLCELVENGEIVYATNAYPMYSTLCVDNIGCGRVLDRMNSRYSNRIDLAMRLDEKDRALKFGLQKLAVKLIK